MNFPFFSHAAKPVIRERSEHCISRSDIDPDALKVLYRLSREGYIAYLVGGGVRDLLLGRKPKDFDVGTNATPHEIKRIFRNCFLIGRRFRLAHILFGRNIIETSTFRRRPDPTPVPSEYGMCQMDDNTFGTPEEDANRRDFTVNGLFYDIKTFAVIDYVGGLKDLEKRVLRSIGDPAVRFCEDPVRMMRAVKFASRLEFTIERVTLKAIKKYHSEILKASIPRLYEELTRLFSFRSAERAFRMMWSLGLLSDLLPELSEDISRNGGERADIWKYLRALDNDPESESASNAVRIACLYQSKWMREVGDSGRRSRFSGRTQAVLREVVLQMKMPRTALQSAVCVLESGYRFQEPPDSSRVYKFMGSAFFAEALMFRRVVAVADGADTSVLKEWERAYAEFRDRHNQGGEKPGAGDGFEPWRESGQDDENPRPRRNRRRRYGRHRSRRRDGSESAADNAAQQGG